MSGDGTSDQIVYKYGTEDVFRLNYDIWSEYDVTYSPDYWSITNPSGHKITSKTATKAFWWKTFMALPDFEKHISNLMFYLSYYTINQNIYLIKNNNYYPNPFFDRL